MAITPLRNRLRTRGWRRPLQTPAASPAIESTLKLQHLKCRLCDSRPDIQLSPTLVTSIEDVLSELLCWEHLAPFLSIWADPRVAEYTVVRL